MSATPAPGQRPSTRRRNFASPRLIRNLAAVLLYIGVAGAIGGVAYATNGATQAQGYVEVTVQTRDGAVLEAPGTSPTGAEAAVLVTHDSLAGEGIILGIPGIQEGSYLRAPGDGLELSSFDSTVAEQLLSRGHYAVIGLCLFGGAVLLRRLLNSINDGTPFQRGNAACIAGIAGLVVVSVLAEVLPYLGSNLVLARIGLDGPDSPVIAALPDVPVTSILVALLLLALAEAFRRGSDMASDVEGLV